MAKTKEETLVNEPVKFGGQLFITVTYRFFKIKLWFKQPEEYIEKTLANSLVTKFQRYLNDLDPDIQYNKLEVSSKLLENFLEITKVEITDSSNSGIQLSRR